MSIVALDAESVSLIAAGQHTPRLVRLRSLLEGASRLGRDVIIPTVVLAELYRGRQRSATLDALLARSDAWFVLRDTDRALARLVGAVLTACDAGSEMIVDAHLVACCVERAGGVIVTGDLRHLERLAAAYPSVVVESLDAGG